MFICLLFFSVVVVGFVRASLLLFCLFDLLVCRLVYDTRFIEIWIVY